ncbi:MAG: apeA [Acidimicrobiaceae bacterium]|nr:apeA [Acidimicrobiaceae bacterium]
MQGPPERHRDVWIVRLDGGPDGSQLLVDVAGHTRVVYHALEQPVAAALDALADLDDRHVFGDGQYQLATFHDGTCRLAEFSNRFPATLLPAAASALSTRIGIHTGYFPEVSAQSRTANGWRYTVWLLAPAGTYPYYVQVGERVVDYDARTVVASAADFGPVTDGTRCDVNVTSSRCWRPGCDTGPQVPNRSGLHRESAIGLPSSVPNSRPLPARRLTGIGRLAADIRAARGDRRRTVGDSADWLTKNVAGDAPWEGIEDLAVAAYDDQQPDASARAICHHIEVVRGELSRQLWSRQIFVGVSLLDDLLYNCARESSAEPVLAVLNKLRGSGLNYESLLVFPLQAFGILAAGLLRPLQQASTFVLNEEHRFVLAPQTNSLDRTTELLEQTRLKFGLAKPIDPELIVHWRRSRDARWLENNPLLLVAVANIDGYFYENEFLLLGRIRALTAAIVMLCCMQPQADEREAFLFSSSQLNNWETRDIRHYITLTDHRGSHLTGRAVPIHKRQQAGELSELAVELNPRFWNRSQRRASEIYSSVSALYDGYLAHHLGSRRETVRGRTHQKLMEAVDYFRRSHAGDSDDWRSVVLLATSFEMLLTDRFEYQVAERLKRRTALLLRGVRGTRAYQQAVVDLYYARSKAVHSGVLTQADLATARQAFVLCFLAIMRQLPRLPAREQNPMAFLTGDL